MQRNNYCGIPEPLIPRSITELDKSMTSSSLVMSPSSLFSLPLPSLSISVPTTCICVLQDSKTSLGIRLRVTFKREKRISDNLKHLTAWVLTKPQMAFVSSCLGMPFERPKCLSHWKICLNDDSEATAGAVNYLPVWVFRFGFGLLPRLDMLKRFWKPCSKSIHDLVVSPGRIDWIPVRVLNETPMIFQPETKLCLLSGIGRQHFIKHFASALWYIQFYVVNEKWRTYSKTACQQGNQLNPKWSTRWWGIWSLKPVRIVSLAMFKRNTYLTISGCRCPLWCLGGLWHPGGPCHLRV